MPSRLEKDALTTAAATLPRAMAGKAMEDCTVEGSSVRNSKPARIDGGIAVACWVARPIRGKTAKVVPSVARCSLHALRSEEHTSELQSLMRISYAVFCLKKKTYYIQYVHNNNHTTRL